MKNKVKPCPVCGSNDIHFFAFSLSPECSVCCYGCDTEIQIEVPLKHNETSEQRDERCYKKLLKEWNKRSK